MSFLSMLNQRMTIERLRSTLDASGGQTLSYDVVRLNEPCRIAPASQEDREQFAQMGIIVTKAIYSRYDEWGHGDRVTDSVGRVLFVRATASHDAAGTLGSYTIAYCEDK